MKKFEIHLNDYQRILVGEVPGLFYVEVVIRAIVFYLILIGAMRLMGRRMASQLSRIEMAAMVSLAAAIGVPLQSPDRGILPAMVIALVVVGVERCISYFTTRNEKFEARTQDHIDMLVLDGVLKLKEMKRTRITKDRLCAHIRAEGLTHLGRVQRLYLEANGTFTMIKASDPKPGLNIIPEWDDEFINEQERTDKLVCRMCGKQKGAEDVHDICFLCNSDQWEGAMIDKVSQ